MQTMFSPTQTPVVHSLMSSQKAGGELEEALNPVPQMQPARRSLPVEVVDEPVGHGMHLELHVPITSLYVYTGHSSQVPLFVEV